MSSFGRAGGPRMLSSFPPELFGQISAFISAVDVTRLILTGDVALARLLSFPKALWQLDIPCAALQSVHFPNLALWAPHLHSLILSFLPTSTEGVFTDLSLNKLPRNLVELDIHTLDPANLFCKEGSYLGLKWILPNLAHLRADIGQSLHSELLQNLPSSLTSLQVFHWDMDVVLPPTLLKLHVMNPRSKPELPFTLLPRCLESLEVANTFPSDRDDEFVSILPPSLLFLRLNPFYGRLSNKAINMLPAKLVTLGCDLLDGMKTAESTLPLTLPPLLTELFVNEIHESYWTQLPRSLTFLSMSKRSMGCTPNDLVSPSDSWFALFPPNLTQLKCDRGHILQNLPKSAPFLAHLKRLECPQTNLPPSVIGALPPDLEQLSVNFMDDEHISQLPPSLKHLSVSTFWLTPEGVSKLPKGLRTLSGCLCRANETKESVLRPHSRIILPFTVFELQTSEEKAGFYIHVLDRLAVELATNDFYFPNSLEYMSVEGVHTLGDSWVAAYKGHAMRQLFAGLSLATNASFKHLSPHLLSLRLSDSHKITGEAFVDLPRTLTELVARQISEVKDEHIAALPRILKTLQLNKAVYLTHECISFLPLTVTEVSFGQNTNFTKENTFHLLPRSLMGPSWCFTFISANLLVKSGCPMELNPTSAV